MVISVTGNSNSGKTVFSYYLGLELAYTAKVVVISTNSTQPIIKELFSNKKDNSDGKSLGKLLSLAVVTKEDIFDNMVLVADNMSYLSYTAFESSLNYPEIAEFTLKSLFAELELIVDYIIVDTATPNNQIDEYVLSTAPKQISITTADSKGYFYRERYKPTADCNVLYRNSPYNPLEDVLDTFNIEPKLLAYYSCFEAVFNGSDITDIIVPKAYGKTVEKIVDTILL